MKTAWCIWEVAAKGSVDQGRKWGGSRRTKPCVFPCKVTPAGDERYLVCAAGAAAAAVVLVPPLCSATSSCSCVRSSIRFLNLRLQIALEWLRDCCHLVLPCA